MVEQTHLKTARQIGSWNPKDRDENSKTYLSGHHQKKIQFFGTLRFFTPGSPRHTYTQLHMDFFPKRFTKPPNLSCGSKVPCHSTNLKGLPKECCGGHLGEWVPTGRCRCVGFTPQFLPPEERVKPKWSDRFVSKWLKTTLHKWDIFSGF